MKTTLIFILLMSFSPLTLSYDLDNGEQLHIKNCLSCHNVGIYTRKNRLVNSLPKLGTQVRFCRDNLGLTWFDDEVDDVIHYLNSKYYKFQ